MRNAAAKGYLGKDICVLAMTTAQMNDITNAISCLARAGKPVTQEYLPRVATVGRMQGFQARWVIADAVISDGDTFDDLDNTSDATLFNSLTTHAREALTMLLPTRVFKNSGLFKENAEIITGQQSSDVRLRRLAPLEYLHYATQNHFVYQIPSGRFFARRYVDTFVLIALTVMLTTV